MRSFSNSFRLVPHKVSGILPTLWLTMWPECEDFVSLNEDPYYHKDYWVEEPPGLDELVKVPSLL